MLYITDIRAFLTIAKYHYFKLQGNYCVRIFRYDADCYDEIKVNLKTGEIKYIQWCDNIAYYPPPDHQLCVLQEFNYLIKEKHFKKFKGEK